MNVLYFLDAKVFIDANRDYYPLERAPEFWYWLVAMGELGQVRTGYAMHVDTLEHRKG